MMQSRSYEQAASLADDLMDMYLNGHLDKVVLTYTHFKSAGSQQIVDEVLLPVTVPAGESEQESDYILEPSAAELMKVLLPKVIRRCCSMRLNRVMPRRFIWRCRRLPHGCGLYVPYMTVWLTPR